jgi:hypothetical protein
MHELRRIAERRKWFYCVICDERVSRDDSVEISWSGIFRACKKHYSRFLKDEGAKEAEGVS